VRIPPHIINSSLVDCHCTLYCPAGIPHWTQRSPRALHAAYLLMRDWPSLVTSSNCLLVGHYCPTGVPSAGFPSGMGVHVGSRGRTAIWAFPTHVLICYIYRNSLKSWDALEQCEKSKKLHSEEHHTCTFHVTLVGRLIKKASVGRSCSMNEGNNKLIHHFYWNLMVILIFVTENSPPVVIQMFRFR
jgi:hypothetical protein